jgi:hypothetical protein
MAGFSAIPGAFSTRFGAEENRRNSLPCVAFVGGSAGSAAGAAFRFAATHEVHHIRYKHAHGKEPRRG